MPAFTARNVAKFAVKTIVASQASSATTNVLVNYTSLDEDDTTVQIGSHVVGWGVSEKLKPYTDRAVDKIADKFNEHKAKKNAKKSES